MSAPKARVCGHCAGAPRNKAGAFLAHMACQVEWCACRKAGHVVSETVAEVQRKYTGGPAESDLDQEEPA